MGGAPKGFEREGLRRRAAAAILLALAAAPPAAAGGLVGIFHDGFEECGAGRWSTGTFAPIPEQLTGLTANGLAQALGACPPSLTAASYRLSDGSAPGAPALLDMSDKQSSILDAFGTGGVVPRAGGAMVALSSGTARDATQPGFVPTQPGNAYTHPSTGPTQFMSAHGNLFPGLGDCPDGANSTNDSVGLRLEFTVPAGADRLVFDWRYFTADYPEWVCSAFEDYALAIVVTGTSPSLPVDRNVMLDSAGRPISTDSVDIDYCTGCSAGTAELLNTGYPANEAGATGWRTASIPVVPEETLVVHLLVFDVSDNSFDNLVLFDNLRWLHDE